jgi:LPXTG-site transpeptidase (sortase) family protein
VPIVPTDVPETYAPITRLLIPSIGVDAAVEVKSIGADGVMQAPGAPDVVTWYDFSSPPAGDGNAVFAGHLDYAGYGPAVFWRLGDLQGNDVIEVFQQDGTNVRYRVTSVRPFAATDDARAVIASTGRPTITLITCEGTFDGQARAYDQRLVVTGDRID